MRIGILTGGGDCPGLNSTIRAIFMRALDFGYSIFGFFDGWKGVIEDKGVVLTREMVEDIMPLGGTILYSSRTNPFKVENGVDRIKETLKKERIDALIAIGGDDTLGVASRLYEEYGIKTVGVPKTMDNDIGETDYTFGFDSSATISMDAIERLKDTAKAMKRVIVLEVMGRHAGWVALFTGLSGGADYTLLPEEKYNEEEMIEKVKRAFERKKFAVVCVSEGVNIGEREEVEVDAFGHKLLQERGVGSFIARVIKEKTGIQTRSVQIGHIQRGGSPTLFDRILTIRLGVKAVDMVKDGEFGRMVTFKDGRITSVPLKDAVSKTKVVTEDWIKLKRIFEK